MSSRWSLKLFLLFRKEALAPASTRTKIERRFMTASKLCVLGVDEAVLQVGLVEGVR